MKKNFVYSQEHLNEISFPLGGIGSGCIGLSGNGRLIDWEIFGRPNKGSLNGFTHFAVKAEGRDGLVSARILQGDLQPPFSGYGGGSGHGAVGIGPSRGMLTGVPHFSSARFDGRYPFAEIAFSDPGFPGEVVLSAYNPLIPLNDEDSSLPGAFFEIRCTNPTDSPLDYTVAMVCSNPFPLALSQGGSDTFPGSINGPVEQSGLKGLFFHPDNLSRDECGYGDMAVLTDSDQVSIQENWFRGSWWDDLTVYWNDLCAPGHFKNRTYSRGGKPEPGRHDSGIIAAHVAIGPGEEKSVRFAMTWSFPLMSNYWSPEASGCCGGEDTCCSSQRTWKHYYATRFETSIDSAVHGLKEWDTLHRDTKDFHDTLFSSTIPEDVLDAVSANISILKSPTVLRLEDGTFYGFEGCNPQSGCCEGSCTHVWNYAYALPFLFPALERSMRDIDYAYNLDDAGGMRFRLQLPVGREKSAFRPCADGQFGGILKLYRDWKISGDTEWLKSHWEDAKKNISYAWSAENPDRWDADRDGVLEGRQHHTLDMELFGPNSWLTGMYLGALLAGAEIAEAIGDVVAEKEYRELFEKGRGFAEDKLFNGSYFYHIVDLKDRSVLELFDSSNIGTIQGGRNATDSYWDTEHEEIKYQIGDGCAIDQVLAQWHANISGLGKVFSKEKTRTALKSIYDHNFIRKIGDHFNPCRIYSLQDEAGVVICSFPGEKPLIPVPYAEETMNGFEYQAAIHMIQEGMITEGLEIVTAIRNRYDGHRRNPWNEFECGSNYARSMASYALLPALSGFSFDMPRGEIGFNPIATSAYDPESGEFSCFFSLGSGWGEYTQTPTSAAIRVTQGSLSLRCVKIPALAGSGDLSAKLGDVEINFATEEERITFSQPITISAEKELLVTRV